MLTPHTRSIVAATAPVIAERIGSITPVFYKRMFEAHPELLDGMFSRANQRSGEQPRALAASIVGFATALLESDSAPQELIERIAHKHTALGVTAEQYQIVYENLFSAIADDLGEAATTEVVAAWTEIYWLFADILIARERTLYGQQANDRMWMPWRVSERIVRTPLVTEFAFEPADDTPVTEATAGQFVSVKVTMPDGLRQARQYTLLQPGIGRRIAVRRDEEGEVSPVLHDSIQVGDVVELSNPYGSITLDAEADPLVLVSAGIGCTPTLSYLEAMVAAGSEREVVVLHADRDSEAWAFGSRVTELVDRLPGARMRVWFDDVDGFGTLRLGDAELPDDARIQLCGPLPFMKGLHDEARASGIPDERVRYEIFGPDIWLAGV